MRCIHTKYYDSNVYTKKKKEDYRYDLNLKRDSIYKSNYIEFNLDGNVKEKCINMQVEEFKYIKVFGEVKDLEGNVVKNKKCTLLKTALVNYKTEYIPVCYITTDTEGKYEVILNEEYDKSHYIIRVSDE